MIENGPHAPSGPYPPSTPIPQPVKVHGAAPKARRHTWLLVVGVLFAILPFSHAANGAWRNPVSAVLGLLVFGGTSVTLIRWWYLTRRDRLTATLVAPTVPRTRVLVPALFGIVFLYGAISLALDWLWRGINAEEKEAIPGLGALGLLLLALAAVLHLRRGR
ncbi:hypothetical protein ACFT9M_19345 [Micromonospora purpureochromogenes]|uniref:hypothetical protein n=1 Tax=Micromonospora purpureochromogenes TaxID=47872 RepID=UPI00363531BF